MRKSITLLRHAQASIHAENYDQLSALGQAQAQRLGRYWQRRERHFDLVAHGTLVRQRETQRLATAPLSPPAQVPIESEALNELPFQTVVDAYCQQHPNEADVLTLVKSGRQAHPQTYLRCLKRALALWQVSREFDTGLGNFTNYQTRVLSCLQGLCDATPEGQRLLVVSSGGPISLMCAMALGADAALASRLMFQLHNTGVCELSVSTQGEWSLHSFNELGHCHGPDESQWITFI